MATIKIKDGENWVEIAATKGEKGEKGEKGDPQTALQLTIVDSGGYYNNSNVEEVVQEIGSILATKASTGKAIAMAIVFG
jgi:hypothetical protein